MLCELFLSIGLIASCGEPPRDEAAEVLRQQQAQHEADFQTAMQRRSRLYGGMETTDEGGTRKFEPFRR